MRVGVYIDGLNLYYGGRDWFGRSQPGWRWLDLRQLAQRLITKRVEWVSKGAVLERVVYCTAFIDGNINRDGRRRQSAYIGALRAHGSIDHLEEGRFVARIRRGLLATDDGKGRPMVFSSSWPVMVRDEQDRPVPNARFMVSYLHLEEKGSDVNVASHVLTDVLENRVDAAIVVSNDSDLKLPIRLVRRRVSVGVVNPSRAHLAGDLRGNRSAGVGGHWWYQLEKADFSSCQLPKRIGHYRCPTGW